MTKTVYSEELFEIVKDIKENFYVFTNLHLLEYFKDEYEALILESYTQKDNERRIEIKEELEKIRLIFLSEKSRVK